MANVTQGLFGFDPSQVAPSAEQNQELELQRRIQTHIQMNPRQQAQAAMFRAGSQVASAGANFMGIKDPQLEAQSIIQQTAKTLDLTDYTSVRNVANEWLKSGNAVLQDKALKLNDVADRAEQSANQRTRERGANELAERKAANQAAFSKEYSEAKNADERLAVTRKYADMPELLKLDEASLARKEKYEAAAVDRAEKAEAKKEAQEALFAQQRFLAGEGAKTRAAAAAEGRASRGAAKAIADDYKVTLAQEKINAAIAKGDDSDAKASRSAQGGITHADQMIADVKDVNKLVKFETTGRTGQAAAAINPGGEAGTLRTRLATIKANIGFDRLQKMRDESPTGGALGQVAVQELVALQASVASLDPLQSDVELARSLSKVAKHYDGWKKTIEADEAARGVRRASVQGINLPGATPRNNKPAAATASGWGRAVESK